MFWVLYLQYMRANNLHISTQSNNFQTYLSNKASIGYASPYLSPSNLHKKSQINADQLQKRYPHSYKYQNWPINPTSPISTQKKRINYEVQDHVQIEELSLIISQLRSSLHVSQNNQQRLEQDLCVQRRRICDQIQKRRRLQDELKRMEFQLQRLGNYETLSSRQTSIKLQTLTRENSKLCFQVNDLLEQLQKIKQQKRNLMTECDSLMKDRQVLAVENQALQSKLDSLQLQINKVKKQIRQVNHLIPSRVNQIPTGRSQTVPTRQGSPGLNSMKSIQLQELQEQIDYQEENQKLLQDYQKLVVENQSIKRLYQQFYKMPTEQSLSVIKQTIQPADNLLYQLKSSFSNQRVAQQLRQSEDKVNGQIELMLKTSQKQQITEQLAMVRDEAINQLLKCYEKAIERSQKEKINSLKLFTEDLNTKIQTYSKMAQNYLEMRSTIKQQAKISFPRNLIEVESQDQDQRKILQIYKSVKENAKGEKQSGLSLAVFRLLTLLSKFKDINDLILSNMKHSTLKYIYKMAHLSQNRYKID